MKQSFSKSRSGKVAKGKGKIDGSSHIPKPKMSNPSVRTHRSKRGGCIKEPYDVHISGPTVHVPYPLYEEKKRKKSK